eukprot:6487848-Amphidinium_carterae.2
MMWCGAYEQAASSTPSVGRMPRVKLLRTSPSPKLQEMYGLELELDDSPESHWSCCRGRWWSCMLPAAVWGVVL